MNTEQLDALRDYFKGDEWANLDEVYDVLSLIQKPIYMLFKRLSDAGFMFFTDVEDEEFAEGSCGPFDDNPIGPVRDLEEVDALNVMVMKNKTRVSTMFLIDNGDGGVETLVDYTVKLEVHATTDSKQYEAIVSEWMDAYDE